MPNQEPTSVNRLDEVDSTTMSSGASDPVDAAEFSRLYEDSRRKLWLIAAAIVCDRTEADDLVQEAAVVGLSKLGEFRRGTNFEAWMGQITRHVALNALRRKTRRTAALTRAASWMPSQAAESAMHQPLDARLAEGLSDLDETARSCLMMRVVGDMPYPVIGEVLGIPEGTAMSHVFRARRKLRDWLQGSESSTGERGGHA